MKKIVFVAQSNGGVAEYLYMFLKNWKDNLEYEKYLVVSNQYKEQEERFKKYVKNIYYVDMTRNMSFSKDLRSIKDLKKVIKEIKPDIVYLHSSKAGGIGRLALWFNKKIKVIYNAHGWYFNAQISEKKKKIYILMEKILAKHTDMIVNISKDEYESAVKNKIAPKEKMCIIENGIDFSKFKDSDKYREITREKYNINKDEVVIGVVGRLTEQKDPMTSVKAFKLINENYSNTKLMFVGSGELERDVIHYAKENGIYDKVIITGWVNDVEKYIPAFDIAILPSKWEGFGLVLVEYMACNKPIVASNVGGIKDIINDNENGLLIEKNNYNELFEKISMLLENKVTILNFIRSNEKYRNKYDICNLVNKHDSILGKLITKEKI